ncbi:MAG: hypothetical protein ABFS42_04625 [Candidatus Krumholzibacteriota bacterium]
MNTFENRRVSIGVLIAAVLVLTTLVSPVLADEDPGGATLKVGTFDSRCVAFAYGQTKGEGSFFARIQELKREYAAAEKAGDTEKTAELEEQGESLQHQMHLKVFCGTPIDDILDLVRDDIPKAATAAGVDLIVGEVLYQGPAVEIINVTTEMVKLFTTDPEVIGALAEIQAAPVVDPEEFAEGRH